MNCIKCGNTINEGESFCTKCGTNQNTNNTNVCPKCNSSNVCIQVVNESKLKNKHHGIVWWICVGWWWIPIKWVCFTGFAIILKLFGHKKQKIKNITKTMYVCQNCENHWKK